MMCGDIGRFSEDMKEGVQRQCSLEPVKKIFYYIGWQNRKGRPKVFIQCEEECFFLIIAFC